MDEVHKHDSFKLKHDEVGSGSGRVVCDDVNDDNAMAEVMQVMKVLEMWKVKNQTLKSLAHDTTMKRT
jgi:hypothetical protein